MSRRFIGSIFQWKEPGPKSIYITLTDHVSLLLVDREIITSDITEYKGHDYNFDKKHFVKIS